MFEKFIPDLMAQDVYKISFNALKEKGISVLLFDIDNTLAPYELAVPDEKLLGFLAGLRNDGFQVAFLSNNKGNRVEVFNETLQFFAVSDAKKPSTKSHKKALAHFGSEAKKAAVIGDQIFTDVWSGKRCGMYTILVPPIKDKTSLFFKVKRALEQPFIKRYRKEKGELS